MLYLAKSLQQLQFGKLMEVYIEGNLEKAAEVGLLQAEQDFYQYLRDCFSPLTVRCTLYGWKRANISALCV